MLNRLFNTFGAPKRFISDNEGAFISEETKLFIKNGNIEWTFTKQASPWTGGFFERLVKSVKRCLKKKKSFSQYPEKCPEPFEYPSFNHMLR